jgi:hypothetical protein
MNMKYHVEVRLIRSYQYLCTSVIQPSGRYVKIIAGCASKQLSLGVVAGATIRNLIAYKYNFNDIRI